jgi:hypothetical protein
MIYARYVVFDDAPQVQGLDRTADQFADALRCPLGAIGVRVIRQHGAGLNSPKAGFQAHGWSRSQYNAKLNAVGRVVNGITEGLGVTESLDFAIENQSGVLVSNDAAEGKPAGRGRKSVQMAELSTHGSSSQAPSGKEL